MFLPDRQSRTDLAEESGTVVAVAPLPHMTIAALRRVSCVNRDYGDVTSDRSFDSRRQAKFLTCEISKFTPCAHAQSNVLHT